MTNLTATRVIKERPILFSTPMVQAILDGRKTQTRRVIKSRHESGLFQVCRRVSDGQITAIESLDWDERNCEKDITCPYGQAGDLLWVRETWMSPYALGHPNNKIYNYKADRPDVKEPWGLTWKPSIHMPKAAARIWLQVKEVWVEPLHCITEEDAIAEGIEVIGGKLEDSPVFRNYLQPGITGIDNGFGFPENSFKSLWKSINGPDSWEANPWVWVVKYEVLSTTGKPKQA